MLLATNEFEYEPRSGATLNKDGGRNVIDQFSDDYNPPFLLL